MPFNLHAAMVSGLMELGHDEDTATQLWTDVCGVRGKVRTNLYEGMKFTRVSFAYHGLTLRGIVHEVRIQEDKGVQFHIDIGGSKVWVDDKDITTLQT